MRELEVPFLRRWSMWVPLRIVAYVKQNRGRAEVKEVNAPTVEWTSG